MPHLLRTALPFLEREETPRRVLQASRCPRRGAEHEESGGVFLGARETPRKGQKADVVGQLERCTIEPGRGVVVGGLD